MASIPAWQTEELGEEWVEASPSPPGSPEAPPQPSTHNKRGSLRSLGAGVARPLPPSRKGSTASNPDFSRAPSNPYMRSASGMLSPPTSISGSEDDAREREAATGSVDREASPIAQPDSSTAVSEPAAGTFLVKDGEDSHGKAFPRNPFQKDMFSALALEKMFEPPSPASAAAATQLETIPARPSPPPMVPREDASGSDSSTSEGQSTPTSAKSREIGSPLSDASSPASARSGSSKSASPASSSSGQTVGTVNERRVSHQYAPVHPSRLSKSMTPSDNSFATSTEITQETFNASAPTIEIEDGPTVDYRTHDGPTMEGPTVDYHTLEPEPSAEEQEESGSEPEEESFRGTACEIPSENPSPERQQSSDDEPPVTNTKYPFIFTAPAPPTSREQPVFDPSLAPLNSGEPTSSTLRQLPASGLRLFRNTYDTYTREQLSALVDSIAVQPSPSPPTNPPTKLRQWSPADSESPLRSNSSGSTASTPVSGSSADIRSSKRLRLSPPSPHGPVGLNGDRRAPPRGPAVVRDWHAHGRALMDRIRVTDPEISATSESMSGTGSWDSNSREGRSRTAATPFSDGFSGYDGAPTYEYTQSPVAPAIFTTSPSQAEMEQPGGNFHSNPSTASSDYLHRAEDMMSRIKSRVVSPSTSTTVESPRFPRRHLSESSRETFTSSDGGQQQQRLRASAAPRTVAQPRSESDESQDMSIEESEEDSPPMIQRSAGSRTSVEGAGLPSTLPVNRDDLNRFMSASTYTTGTAVSTSFVKHAGPRDPALAPTMTHIGPGDVPGALAERVGGMRYDRKSNRWVRDVSGGLGPVDEAGESRQGGSEESVDIFAGIESIHSGDRTRGSSAVKSLPRAAVRPQEIMDETDTTEDDVQDVERTPRGPTHLQRPRVEHSHSAPPILKTPNGPSTPGVLRSALRNANSTPASAMKRAAWHPDLTPGPAGREGSADRSVSYKRSVSFSDNYIAPPRSAGGSISKKRSSNEEEAREGDATNASWLPSVRTRRIQTALEAMAEMTISDATPSKPARAPLEPTKPMPDLNTAETEEDDDDTVEPIPFGNRSFRSFRSRGGNRGDATFLTECSFGVAHDRLVELITDVQPFHPHWEQLRSIDLSNKCVETLARLKEFLPQLDEARLENNAIAYLSGIPNTIRTLHVAGNQLSSLTSVNHLRNLQYLDISRNQLDTVGQLECLRHLRELKADGNSITDISGIMAMDSLLKLSVSGNKIERVDLTAAKWDKLESLNLSNNKIKRIDGLHKLKSVSSLNLDNNYLTELEPSTTLQSMRSLRFSDNDINFIDLSRFPKLRTLFADNNALPGLSRSMPTGGHRIENLSIRNQRVGNLSLSAEDLQSVKRLYVSGNRLEADFLPRLPLFHLVYLEAAACNLSSWPEKFAQRVPNLRILNVNYNFLDDLDGLAGMLFIRKLMVVGNRLGGGGPAAVRGLAGLTALEEIDMRMNPSTLSFYLPIMLPNSKTKEGAVAPDANWPSLDTHFRRQLPDKWYSRRLVYRGLVMAACPDLRILDALKVEEGERRKAAMLLEHANAASSQ